MRVPSLRRIGELIRQIVANERVRGNIQRYHELAMLTETFKDSDYAEMAGREFYLLPFHSTHVELPDKRDRIRITRNKKAFHKRQTIGAIALGPIAVDELPYSCETDDPENELRAIIKRSGNVVPRPQEFVWELIDEIVAYFCSLINPMARTDPRYLLEKWLAESSYPESRKEQLREAFTIREHQQLKSRDFHCKAFLKPELLDEGKHARGIISRSDVFKARVGGATHEMEQEVFHRCPLAKYFVKGTSPEEFPRLMDDVASRFPMLLETDYSSFEGSFSLEYQQHVEVPFFKHFLQHNPDILRDVLASYTTPSDIQHKNPIIQRILRDRDETARSHPIHFKYHDVKLPDNRKSGEMWTSLMNGLSNLVNMFYAARKRGVNFDGFVEGDDGFFGVSSPAITSDDFRELGFTIKMQYATTNSDLNFCGVRYSRENLRAITDARPLVRIGWSAERRYFKASQRRLAQLLKAKAMSFNHIYSHTPVIGPLAHVLACKPGRVRLCDLDRWELSLVSSEALLSAPREPLISARERALFRDITGMSIYAQVVLEARLVEAPTAPFSFPGATGIAVNHLVTVRPTL